MSDQSEVRAAYLHVPFCRHHCGYCNFSVIAGRDDLIGSFFSALATELSWLEQPREVDTLYFGGGTPTHLPADKLKELCELAKHWHPLAEDYEWTVEANPGDLDSQHVDVLAEQGVNRVSLGSQSFEPEKLRLLERDHLAEDIARAVSLVKQANMEVSLDLIFAVPGETLANWAADLREALALQPDHISTYGLTFEKGTSFYNRLQNSELASLPEELEREMYLCAIDQLTAAGLEHYEVSNFAMPGCRSKHNQVYWSGSGYFAAGPGAARYVDGRRETNHRSTTTYLKRVLAGESPVAESETLESAERAREFLIFSLRRLEGIEREVFQARTGFELDALAGDTLGQFVAEGLLADDGSCVRLTREGLLVSDSLWPELV